jgi:parallel beta-helix repeat protein
MHFIIIISLAFLAGCRPTIRSFTADNTAISEGESVTLSWVTTGATTVYLAQMSESGGSTTTVELSGSKTVYPSETTTYTLRASNRDGSINKTLTITVNQDTERPIISFFTASATLIEKGDSVTLSWETTGATNVYLEHSSLSSAGGESVGLSGSTTVSPDEDTDYILTATNSAGTTTATVTVTIKLPVFNQLTGVYYKTIQEAINDAEADSTLGAAIIIVSPGTYYENLLFRKDFLIYLFADSSDPAEVIIDGREINPAVQVIEGGRANLNGLTIQNGRAYDGGGIYVKDSGVSLDDCVVRDNEAVRGGGAIYVKNGDLYITDSTIRDNDANSYGGGIYMENSSVTIRDNIISGNATDMKGGGIYIKSVADSEIITIQSNTIRENEADNSIEEDLGGGIYINDEISVFSVQIGGTYSTQFDYFNTICSNEPDQVKPEMYIDPSYTNWNYIDNVCR